MGVRGRTTPSIHGIDESGRRFAKPSIGRDGEEPSRLCGARAGAGVRGRASGARWRCGRRGRACACGRCGRVARARACCGTRAGVWAAQHVQCGWAAWMRVGQRGPGQHGCGRATRTGRASPVARALQTRLITGPWPHIIPPRAREGSARDPNPGRRGASRVSWGGYTPGTFDCQPAFPLPFLTSGSVPLDNCGAETLPLALC